MITVMLNGGNVQTMQKNLQQLLAEIGQTKGRFAVEVNGELIPKSQLTNTLLTDKMTIEVVQAVGGG